MKTNDGGSALPYTYTAAGEIVLTAAGEILLMDMVTYGYGERLSWDELQERRDQLAGWVTENTERYNEPTVRIRSHMTLTKDGERDVVERLREVERLLDKYDCPCGAGGPMACEDWCPGDLRSESIRAALRIIIEILRPTEGETGAPR